MTDKQLLSTSPMKQSVSLTSLPPSTSAGSHDVNDPSVAAKLLIERPYNSLKKKRNPERDLWRNSWGSNQSYSSCSLQSSTFIGKDDFWLALQPNYNYIMDTNLLDSCREARGEIERQYPQEASHTDQKKINVGKPPDEYIVDLKRLRRWLREMENQLSQFPTISDAIQLKEFELEKLQKKNAELYRIIASHAKLIGACTRSLSRQRDSSETPTSVVQNNSETSKIKLESQSQHQSLQNDEDNCFSSLETHTTRRSHNSSNSNTECNLKALERRYHSLYLKSFEISLLFENLLAHKNDDLKNSKYHSSSSDVDEGPAAKLARFTNDLIAESHSRKVNSTNTAKRKLYDSTDENGSDEDVSDDCQLPNYFDDTVIPIRTNGFDADSEGSDSELVPNTNRTTEERSTMNTSDHNGNPIMESMDSSELIPSNTVHISGSSNKSNSLPTTPCKQNRQRKHDATKFNNSNRESKNCATFYFKHSDTEPETGNMQNSCNDWSSQDANSEVYSEDDQWVYSNGNDVNGNASIHDGSVIEANDMTAISMQVNINDSLMIDTVDGQTTPRKVCMAIEMDNKLKLSSGKKPEAEIKKCKESILELVNGAENLVLTPPRVRPLPEVTLTARKVLCSLNTSTKFKRVENWLQNQTTTMITDGEASCEYTTESDARDSDGSEGLADSIATTCLPGAGNKSQFTSSEVINGSEDLPKDSSGSHSTLARIVPRIKRRNSERPVSVSCISQLTKSKPSACSSDDANNQGLANHSISESALNMLNIGNQTTNLRMNGSGSKSSLKKRRLRLKKKQRSESGSNGSETSGKRRGSRNSLMRSESSGNASLLNEQKPESDDTIPITPVNEDEVTLPKPNFQLGALTSNVFNAKHLGTLASLTYYNLDGNGKHDQSFTGTEDNSNLSEQQVWDDYQEKYMSEAYSEGRDSDAARKLLEFGDDYRNFIDSQSDCCSSLSAANNLDSLSPPRARKPFAIGQLSKPLSKSPSDDDNTMRRRRALELGIERRHRAHAEMHRKSSTDDRRKISNGNETILSRASYKSQKTPKATMISRKLENEFTKALLSAERRRSRPNGQISSSSAASSDAENDSDLDIILNQSQRDLENTQALKVRRHLLHSEDYTEIIATCRENIRCLKLLSPGGQMLSSSRFELIRELLSSWESLLHWSENESFVKQSQEEMATLISKLSKIGTSQPNLDTESAIQIALQETKDENVQLHTYRSSMLRLNASVHSWLTRHEKRKQIEMSVNKMAIKSTPQANNNVNQNEPDENGNANVEESTLDLTTVTINETSTGMAVGTSIDADDFAVDEELHKQLKNEVGNMYKIWDEADERVKNRLESLTTSLIAWKQFESGINEFKEALGKDTGTLKRITGALELGSDVVTNHLASDVKEVAKRLSEKMDNHPTMAIHSGQQQTSSSQTSIKLNHIGPMAFNMPSNGSLSDSGISDGGFSSDYGLSERERRLGALRRLAKQLEQALVPGSEALNSINQRMEMAEAELRSLQETCRELIVRTAASHPNHFPTGNQWNGQSAALMEGNTIQSMSTNVINQQPINFQIPIINVKSKTAKRTTPNKRKPRRRTNSNGLTGITLVQSQQKLLTPFVSAVASEPDPDDPKDGSAIQEDDEKPTWSRRVAKYAVPVQLALIALLCAACFMEPHCCDGLNNFTWSLSPQLRYIRGPPPI